MTLTTTRVRGDREHHGRSRSRIVLQALHGAAQSSSVVAWQCKRAECVCRASGTEAWACTGTSPRRCQGGRRQRRPECSQHRLLCPPRGGGLTRTGLHKICMPPSLRAEARGALWQALLLHGVEKCSVYFSTRDYTGGENRLGTSKEPRTYSARRARWETQALLWLLANHLAPV